jgi:hypothetical protein
MEERKVMLNLSIMNAKYSVDTLLERSKLGGFTLPVINIFLVAFMESTLFTFIG